MSVAELKKKIILKIEASDDEILLKKVEKLVEETSTLSAKDIFAFANEHYGETLKRLAE